MLLLFLNGLYLSNLDAQNMPKKASFPFMDQLD